MKIWVLIFLDTLGGLEKGGRCRVEDLDRLGGFEKGEIEESEGLMH